MRPWITFAISLLAAACTQTKVFEQEAVDVGGERFLKMEAERLPDLNQPRGGHCIVNLNGEITVFGGHTDGFILLKTAEYLKDGKWVEVPMLYPHDFGFSVKLPDGRIMIGGGCAENFGIGQSWGTEIYDPKTHSFEPSGVLDRKRTGCSALPSRTEESWLQATGTPTTIWKFTSRERDFPSRSRFLSKGEVH